MFQTRINLSLSLFPLAILETMKWTEKDKARSIENIRRVLSKYTSDKRAQVLGSEGKFIRKERGA